ncbi:MAG: motility protein A [Candidatus Omnitrophota bacterium]|nr:MAG: motility protein A [Candidatus Omnitrophota bacterium]
MDLSTVIGIIAGILLIVVTILLGGSLMAFVNIPSVAVTIGGMISATLINYPLPKLMGAIAVAQKAFFWKLPECTEIITMLGQYATIARRDGVLALESTIETIQDPFMKKGVQMVVDGTAPDLTKIILSNDMSFLEDRHREGQGIFLAMGTYAPAFGMIGTLIGLVQMLQTMDDPSSIGSGMAVALLTTLYGAIVANLICLPIAGKLKTRSEEEILLKQIVLAGVEAIQSGDSPRIVEEKLKVFIPPKRRDNLSKGQ